MSKGMPFHFEIPVSFFEKASAEAGKQKRIGGIISTERPDRQGEVVLQEGLNFDEFLSNGWFNDNHSKATTDILGYPEMVQKYKKGEKLPDGTIAKANGTWAEGYLLDTPEAERIWKLGQALQKTNRRLGFSVEGGITKRTGKLRKTIAQANVRNVAITNCPVNTDSRLDVLSKSLQAVAASEDSEWEKALTVGAAADNSAPVGPRTGEGAGQIISVESLDRKGRKNKILSMEGALGTASKDDEDKKKGEKPMSKALSDIDAVEVVLRRHPKLSYAQAVRVVEVTKSLKASGRL